jgi:hypothetical protein
VHKVLYHSCELPDVFSNYFTLKRSVRVHETRSQTDIHIQKASTAFGQRSVKYRLFKVICFVDPRVLFDRNYFFSNNRWPAMMSFCFSGNLPYYVV